PFPEVVGIIVHGINSGLVIPVLALVLLILSFFARISGARHRGHSGWFAKEMCHRDARKFAASALNDNGYRTVYTPPNAVVGSNGSTIVEVWRRFDVSLAERRRRASPFISCTAPHPARSPNTTTSSSALVRGALKKNKRLFCAPALTSITPREYFQRCG
ncbi:hypothetical protein ITP53_25690, partial [Nonomuraea sp. K274]